MTKEKWKNSGGENNESKTQSADGMLPYAHWLYGIEGIGSKTIKTLLSRMKSPQEIYNLSSRLSVEELAKRLPVQTKKEELALRMINAAKELNPQREYEILQKEQIQFTCLGHAGYPERLASIPDAPYGMYYRGRLPSKMPFSVALIGARNCSEYGRRMASRFGGELAAAGVQIVSGMARGIDGIGQLAALAAGGYSLGVLGCGVDICYPKENRKLYDMLCENGGICSEYPPGTQPRSSLFPPRNRIISALSDIVLVVEAKAKSGTLITVDMALEQGKDVYAVPGRVTEALSEGCNRLLQQGAQIALSPGDMLQEIMGKTDGAKQREPLLSGIQADILQNLDDVPRSPEKIKERMLFYSGRDIPLPEVMNQLVKLCINGWALQIGNSYFMKA